jgi:hypothetical protein
MNPVAAGPPPRRRSPRHAVPGGVITCPACRSPLKPAAQRCPGCGFTGGDTMTLFEGPPPPLLPILDAAALFRESEIPKIEGQREILRRKFPQFHWRICTVLLPPDTSLPLFGFWLLNACPLGENESADDRGWTILLLINAASGQAAVIPGYAAEPYLADAEWSSVLATMAPAWQAGNPAEAISAFFKSTQIRLDHAWRRYGASRPPKTSR